jgi:hypothetical protein
MADLSINMLPASDSLDDDSLLPVYQYNRAHKIRGQLIKQFAQASVEEYVSAARAAAEQAEQAAKDAQAAADLVAYASERAEEAAQAALAAQNAQAAAEAARIAAEAAASLAAEQAVADAENLLQGYLTDAENAKNDAQTAAESAAKDVEAKLQEYVSDAEQARDDAETAAKTAAAETAAAIESDMQGYLLGAEAAQQAAEQAKADADNAAGNAAQITENKLKGYVADAEKAKDDAESAAGTAAQEAVALVDNQLAQYVADAQTAQQAAEHARDEAKAIAGGDFVSVTDIVDNLITNASNKPLSAAQGVVLRGLIDKLQSFVDDAALCQPDWNQNDETAKDYVKNRFGGYYEKVYDALLEETELNFSHELVNLEDCDYAYTAYLDESTVVSLWEGGAVRVVFDGVTYEKTYESYGFAPDDSVPFGIFADIIDLGKAFIYTLSDEDTHTVEISKIESTAVPVPEEFLPDSVKVQPDWNQNDEYAPDYVKNRPGGYDIDTWQEIVVDVDVTATEEVDASGYPNMIFGNETQKQTLFKHLSQKAFDAISKEDGVKHLVNWNGTDYECTYEGDSSGECYLGGDNYPFCFRYNIYEGYYSYYINDGSETATFTIRCQMKEPVPFHEKYLPKAENVANVTGSPTAEDFNALLNSLRNAGYLASE